MKLRGGADAILAGVNTILADDPSLTFRPTPPSKATEKQLRRIVLDSMARTPLTAKVVSDPFASLTTIVVSKAAAKNRVAALSQWVNVIVAPDAKKEPSAGKRRLDLRWLMKKLGAENVTSLLVEGGGEVNASFLLEGLAQRVAFFYAPKILGGRGALPAVAGEGVKDLSGAIRLREVAWKTVGGDLLMTARIGE